MVAHQLFEAVSLRLPYVYFCRVSHLLFLDTHCRERRRNIRSENFQPQPSQSSPDIRLQLWKEFVDLLVDEWRTLNIISTLLLSADFTLIQVQPAFRPVTRTAAYMSLVAAFMSVVHSTLYIILFQGLKNSWTASDFEEIFSRGYNLDLANLKLWNAFVMICMPALWLFWSLIFFCTSLITLLWTEGFGPTGDGPHNPSLSVWLGTNIAVSVLFFLGIFCLALALKTFWPRLDMPSTALPSAREELETTAGKGESA